MGSLRGPHHCWRSLALKERLHFEPLVSDPRGTKSASSVARSLRGNTTAPRRPRAHEGLQGGGGGGGRSLTATISAHHALSDLRPAPELDGSKLRAQHALDELRVD
ncbi:hypothetical protein PF004_g19536 [Phytophthora fragariae]|uniref:Uncharacterized protein n=1 Tax=Phytophthora fragariae TaxID=53985 RepID=A0A6A3IPA1_9STRA|nr:hypothetical protein PF011_g21560 [Phytophthora fragariae]KAE9198449.1 hypothetical protein PF004_g19536 [Phytophthora fragariae]